MTSILRLIIPAAAAALALLASCGGSNGKLERQGASPPALNANVTQPGLPLPSLLLTEDYPGPRAISFSEVDLIRPGWQYEHSLLNQNVSDANQPLASFSPTFDTDSPSIDGLAYAIYKFDAEDYDRAATLRLSWDIAPANSGDVWIALSDWDSNRWDYFQADSNWRVNFDSTARYLKNGSLLLAAVILTGESTAELASLRLGPAPPVAAVSVTPQSGKPPLTVSFDATASTAGEGTIVKYEWDFDLDSAYETDSDTDAVVEHDYAQGVHQARLRVTSSSGLSATVLSAPITVDANWQHSYGRSSFDYINDMLIDGEGNIYVCGNSDDTDQQSSLSCAMLAKLDQQGELIWARGYRGTGHSYQVSITMEPSGNIIGGGMHRPGVLQEGRALLQRWSADGDLLLSCEYEREREISVNEIFSLNGGIALAGRTVADSLYKSYCAMLELDGEITWTRLEGSSSDNHSICAALLKDPFSSPLGFALGGYAGKRLQITVFNMQGQCDYSLVINTGALAAETVYMHKLIYLDDGLSPGSFLISGNIILESGGRDGFVLGMPLQGDSFGGRRFRGPAQSFGLELDDQGMLLVAGYTAGGTNRGWLGRFELPGLDMQDCFTVAGTEDVALYGLKSRPEGLLIIGHAPNASLIRAPDQKNGTVFSGSWEGISTSGISNDCTMLTSSGTAFDLAPLLTVDSGGGREDAYVALTQLPE